ncbi:MAG TPA: ABC transporter permease [Solirubrobacteraceae bacterium]|jgi:putative ABC transport system permease protein|nr:ABC transporter permease [Solirubrobacteraceae bacterium]
MRLSSIARLYRVRIRARLTQELFAVLGIAIGVSLLFSSQVANTSLNGSVERLTNGIVGRMSLQLDARDSHGFEERLLEEVQRLPGVQAAVPVLEQDANVVGPKGQESVDLVGTDPRLARLGGGIARHVSEVGLGSRARVFTLPTEIAERIGATSIRSITIQLGSGSKHALLVPGLLGRGGASLGDSPIALAPLRAVQTLAGLQGRLTSIYLRAAPNRSSLVRAELERIAGDRLNVRPANFATTLFRRAAGPVDQSTSLFSALSALVGFLFAFNALLLTVPQRRSLIEDLHLDGYTRRMIVEVLLLDAFVLGVIASALGLALGELLSQVLFSSDPGYLSFAFPVGEQRIVTAWSVLVAVGGGMLAATVGVLAPLRAEIVERPSRWHARSSPVWRGRTPWMLAAALVCLLATTLILVLSPRSAIVGVLTLTLALLLCLPAAIELVVGASGRLHRLQAGAASYLALIELRSRANRSRSLAIAATGAIAVFGTVSIESARSNLQRGLDASAHGIDSGADVWATLAGKSNSFATSSFIDSSAEALRRVPGVRAVQLYRGSFLDWLDRRVWVLAPPRGAEHPVAASQIVSGNPLQAAARLRAGGWAVISKAIASERGLRIGDAFTLPSPRPTTLRVAALSTNLGWSPGAIVLNADDYARGWSSTDPSAYLIQLTPSASATVVSRRIRATLGPRTALQVETRGARERMHFAQAAQGLSRLTQIRSLVLIAAILAMAAAMGAMIWQRRARLADMKVDGFSRVVLWRALLWETAALLGVGCALGAVFGLYGQLLLGRALAVVNGFPVIEATPLPVALGSFALITAVAVAIVAVPGYLAARVRPSISFPE